MDYVAFLSVTVGVGVRGIAVEWMAKGDYLRSVAIQSLAHELAVGLAVKTHLHIRYRWGIPDMFLIHIGRRRPHTLSRFLWSTSHNIKNT